MGLKKNHGTTNYECFQGYIYVTGGHDADRDVCQAYGVADCAPDCFHNIPDAEETQP
jgi:hypothetical protein